MKSVSVCVQVLFFCWWLSGDGGVPDPPEAHTVSGVLAKTLLSSLQFWPCLISACVFVCVNSECLQPTALAQLCMSDQSASDDIGLVSLLYWPLQQLYQYGRVLFKVASCFNVVSNIFIFTSVSFKAFYYPFNDTLISCSTLACK